MKINIREGNKYLNYFHRTVFVLLFLCYSQYSFSEIQNKVTLSRSAITLKTAFEEIEKQTDMSVDYEESSIDLSRKVDVAIVGKGLEEALQLLLGNSSYTYEIKGSHILVSPRNAQGGNKKIQVTGIVQDNEGNPVIGANVVEKGTSNGTITDVDGKFLLSLHEKTVLVVSYIGYIPKEINVGNQKTMTIRLSEDTQTLEEVVVVGYGTVRKKDLTGAVGSMKSEEMMQRPSTSITQGLSGRIAGVNVSSNSGRPGGSQTIRIRGYSSINASNEPLYIIDGVPGDINILNPNDIESVEVLKDASSTAIYGTRGSNGVIVVTTKRGKNEITVNYNTYLSLNTVAKKLDVLNAQQFLAVEDLTYANARKFDPNGFSSGKYTDPAVKRRDYLEGNAKGKRALFRMEGGQMVPIYDIDWQDMVERNSFSQIHNLSFTGSTGKTNYGVFLGYTNDQGIIKESKLERFSGRVTIDQGVSNWLKLGTTLSYSAVKERRIDTRVGYNNVPRMMIEMIPIVPYKYDDGTYGRREDYGGMESADNPLSQINENVTPYNSDIFMGNAYAKITFMKGLDFTTTLGVNRTTNMNPYYNSTKSDIVNGIGGNQASVTNIRSTQILWSNVLNYNNVFNKVHSLNAMLGHEAQSYESFQNVATIDGISDDYYQWNNMGAGSTLKAPSSSYSGDKMLSYFARINYSFKDRYLATVTGRFDGSSKFGKDNKFAFFPSAALGWRVTEEEFLKDNKVISNLKPRVSYGFTGNSGIPTYGSMASLSTGSMAYPFGGTRANGIGVGSLANPLLRWEKTGQFNAGFDLGFLNERISLSADYYLKHTTDMLLNAPVPTTSGFSTISTNIGNMRNSGFEFTLNTQNIQTKNFSWSSMLNFSSLSNKITALSKGDADIIMAPNNLTILRVGESVGSFFGYIRDGIWGENEAQQAAIYGKLPGDAKLRDVNNDKKINESDRVILGKGIPDFYGTFTNTFKYKDFDLVVELQYSCGAKIYWDGLGTCAMRQGIANSLSMVLDTWRPDNQGADLEQIRPSNAYYNSLKDDARMYNGSFIRGKNISLGYNLPSNICRKLYLKAVRVTLSAQNVFVITQYPGLDPETTVYNTTTQSEAFAQNIETFGYPKPRTFSFGANITF